VKRTYHFRLRIKQILLERNITQKELAEMTGLREATISEISNNSRTVINKSHLSNIMDALDITKLEDILELKIEEEF
jgi:putative transcriptional regulator